jgi:hypothetical protein
MRTATTLTVLACLLALTGFATTSSAVTVAWSDPDGNGDGFTYTDGGSDNGLYGTPVVSGNRFIFFPQAFKAQDNNGTDGITDEAGDRLFVTIEAAPGQMITGIGLQEWGDYHINVAGYVSVTAALYLTNLTPNQFDVASDTMDFIPAQPIVTVGSGTWEGDVFIDLTGGAPWTKLQLILNNDLVAFADGDGANSKIQKKVASSGVIITVLPEPATLTLLGLGGLLVLGRKRK